MTKKYRGPVMASIHETAAGLRAAGVMEEQTMREFGDLCLTAVRPLAPEEVRTSRLFAKHGLSTLPKSNR